MAAKKPKKPKQNRRLSPEALDALPSTAEIIDMLHGDDFWLGRIQRVLADAGFLTRRLVREEEHPIWQAWLTRTTFALAPDNLTANKQIRTVLRRGGIKIPRDSFTILDRRHDKLRCVFLLELGAPGVLQPCTLYKNRQGELLPPPI